MPHDLGNYIWCAIGTLFALPGVAFIVNATFPTKKMASTVGAVLGALFGFIVTIYIWKTPLDSFHLDGPVLLVGGFFISSVVGMIVALVVNMTRSNSTANSRSSQVEF